MKKVLSRTIIIIAAVIVALAITVTVLCLITRKPMDTFNGYERVEVYALSSTDRIEIDGNRADDKKAIDEALDDADFSLMQGILEGKPGASMKFKTADDERIEYEADKINTINATDAKYKLHFIYDDVRTVTIEGETVKYDRVIMLVGNTDYEIDTVEVVFYESSRIDNEATGNEDLSSEFYTVSPVVFNCRPTMLYHAITGIVK